MANSPSGKSPTEGREHPYEAARLPRSGWFVVAMVASGLLAFALLLFQILLLQRQQTELRELTQEHAFWTLCQPTASIDERTRAFTRLVADGHREWRSAATQGLILQGSNLNHAKLVVADLTACDLRDASLLEADLTGARLRTADLSGADLTEATLEGAECLRAIVDEADFHKAHMASISLEQASAKKAQFILADMSEALLLLADLEGANLTGADLTAAILESAKLQGATLSLTNLTEANLTNADLTNSNWWRARGLTTDQLLQFAADFPPTDAADSSRIQDYLLWADNFGSPSRSKVDDNAQNSTGE